MNILEEAKEVLQLEAAGIEKLIPALDQRFVNAVTMILESPGRVVVTGMGKSGHIARKVSATLASTGTPALFLHPAEAIHGDLGMVTGQDIILAFSNSGETTEILNILPSLKRIGAKLIAVVGNMNSTLAKTADIVLDATVEKKHARWDLLRRRARQWRSPWGTLWRWFFYQSIILRRINLPSFIPEGHWGASSCSRLKMLCIKASITPLSVKTAPFRMPFS